MDQLIEGYYRFRSKYWAEKHEVFETLAAKGQSPRAIVIACSDSRVPVEVIFDVAPGEIFLVRNVAALVPPYEPNTDYHGTSAALEFAVRKLNVEHIIVMGHSGCGGVQALLRGPDSDDTDFIGTWMKIAEPARDKVLRQPDHDSHSLTVACEHETVEVSLANLLTFPWIRSKVDAGELHLHGWYFRVEEGKLERLNGIGSKAKSAREVLG